MLGFETHSSRAMGTISNSKAGMGVFSNPGTFSGWVSFLTHVERWLHNGQPDVFGRFCWYLFWLNFWAVIFCGARRFLGSMPFFNFLRSVDLFTSPRWFSSPWLGVIFSNSCWYPHCTTRRVWRFFFKVAAFFSTFSNPMPFVTHTLRHRYLCLC